MVLGLGTRSYRCRNEHQSFYYQDDVTLMMAVFDVRFKEFKAQKNMYAVRVDVSPLTQVTNIVAAMDPLLDPFCVVCRFDEVFFARRVPDADPNAVHPSGVLSCFPEFVVLITVAETTSDLMIEGLAEADIFGVYCNPVRIGLRYPQPQFPLLSFPLIPSGCRVEDMNDLVMMLWECCPLHRQQQLAMIMECPLMGTEMILQVLCDGLFT